MEQDGMASVWLGLAESKKSLEEFLRTEYTADGNVILSRFAREYGIEDYDKDFTEWTFHNSATRSVEELLKPHSYSDQIAPQISAINGALLPHPANAVIVLHQFKYDGSRSDASADSVEMKFMGSVPFNSDDD